MAMFDLEQGAYSRAMATDRQNFVWKVYSIVAAQLCATAAIAAPIATASPVWLNTYGGALTTLSLVLSVLLLAIVCCGRGLHQSLRFYPQNMGILLMFTIAESIMVGFTCAMYEAQIVLLCLAVTGGAVIALTAWAVTTKVDATKWGRQLGVAMLGLFVASLVALFVGSSAMDTVVAAGGAVLFSCFLVYDTQMIVGGKHESQRRFDIDDYAFAALQIYMDVIRMFLYLLRLLGSNNRRRR
mmetsp:Transcript_5942/g.13075  ORF Transcript_5942/g.13075 Transcript_5942/m.13075 type:complete len:241 (-) Transcript_5942:207-929(-)